MHIRIPKYQTLILVLIFAMHLNTAIYGQEIDHWETIIETGQSVKYLVPDSPLPVDWDNPGFDDSEWTDGIAGIGYGDDDDNTVDTCLSVYVRYRFTVSNPEVIESLILDMDYDDGFVAYLNGLEIARDNMGEAFSATTWDQLSDGIVSEQPEGSYRYSMSENDVNSLQTGENIFCVEVHNQSASSSDLSSNAYLHAGINTTGSYFSSPPSWFRAPSDPINFDSYLPIMLINTNGQTIPNDPRIVADMGLIYNGPGSENKVDDSLNVYNGKISIEIRGSSSRGFLKKSYTIETQTDTGTNNNVYLLGLPRENDFVLYGPYSDKSLVRNVISYRVFQEMGRWAPRTRFIDLYLNNDYIGIYVLTEKVKVDRFRVNINQLTELDVSAEQISGGYILQIDRTESLASNEYWTSPTVSPISGFPRNEFEYFDPKRDELTDAQAAFIRNWTNNLDAVLASSSYKDPATGYRAYLDVESFVDYLILHEFNKDVDAYRLSTYFYKANNAQGGKLHAGPPWDYNLTLGNADYGDEVWETYKWMYTISNGRYWWPRLMNDPIFENTVFCRWEELGETILNDEWMNALIDSSVQVMGNSIDQNFTRWPVLGVDIWPNYFIGETYESEIYFLKNWISERLQWLDNQWGGNQCDLTLKVKQVIQPLHEVKISPNPSDLSYTTVYLPNELPGEYQLAIHDLKGRIIHERSYYLEQNSAEILLEDMSYLESGMYILRITGSGKMIFTGKLIRR